MMRYYSNGFDWGFWGPLIGIFAVLILLVGVVFLVTNDNHPSVKGAPLPEAVSTEDGWSEVDRWHLLSQLDGDWFFPCSIEGELAVIFIDVDGTIGKLGINGFHDVKVVNSDCDPVLIRLRRNGDIRYEFRGPMKAQDVE